jgi:glycerophosphoryl diester phosphodiesterase
LDLIGETVRLAPKIPRMLISEGRSSMGTLIRQLTTCEAHGLSVNHRSVRHAEYVRYFQIRGFAVWCWTVNDARTANRLIGWGIDGLVGDNPALLRRQN